MHTNRVTRVICIIHEVDSFFHLFVQRAFYLLHMKRPCVVTLTTAYLKAMDVCTVESCHFNIPKSFAKSI